MSNKIILDSLIGYRYVLSTSIFDLLYHIDSKHFYITICENDLIHSNEILNLQLSNEWVISRGIIDNNFKIKNLLINENTTITVYEFKYYAESLVKFVRHRIDGEDLFFKDCIKIKDDI